MTNNTNGKVSVAWQVPVSTGEKNKKKEKGDKDKDKEKEEKNKTNEGAEFPSFEGKRIFLFFYFCLNAKLSMSYFLSCFVSFFMRLQLFLNF